MFVYVPGVYIYICIYLYMCQGPGSGESSRPLYVSLPPTPPYVYPLFTSHPLPRFILGLA